MIENRIEALITADPEVPAFEIRFPDSEDTPVLIYASGRHAGVSTEPRYIINRIPILIAEAEERGMKRGERFAWRWAFALAAIAFLILAFIRWLGVLTP